tara:strand:- start:1582 stop:2598 length:1017 start_codon:yes stop_codon:yes gene_type:complete
MKVENVQIKNRYVIGVHVMFFEIEMFSEYTDGLINLIDPVKNKENITLDFCFNLSEHLEEIDDRRISKDELLNKFNTQIEILKTKYPMIKIVTKIHNTEDGVYYHADYRRDLNYNYCKKVDYVMWGETDSFFPKEAFLVIESLETYTNEHDLHKFILSFSDRKMWDSSWDPLVHVEYKSHVFVDDEKGHLNPNQAKSQLSIEDMNSINSRTNEFNFVYIDQPKISGSCLVLSADLIKFGVNVPSCLIYNDDEGLSVMAKRLLGNTYKQFVCDNILHVHARRHSKKRLYVKDENNPNSFTNKKAGRFKEFKKLSQSNIQRLMTGTGKFVEYNDIFKEEK